MVRMVDDDDDDDDDYDHQLFAANRHLETAVDDLTGRPNKKGDQNDEKWSEWWKIINDNQPEVVKHLSVIRTRRRYKRS